MVVSKDLIMVVKKDELFRNGYFEGFQPHPEVDYESIILSNYEYLVRDIAEEDPSWKQPIGYAMIVNPKLKLVFTYRRSSRDDDYPEKRLQGKWSWGVGGHIEKVDVQTGNPIRASMLREVKEETGLTVLSEPKVLGYINDDSDEVGKVHFGILYSIETGAPTLRPLSPELATGRLKSIGELEKICSSPEFTVEEWSKISLAPLKEYLQSD